MNDLERDLHDYVTAAFVAVDTEPAFSADLAAEPTETPVRRFGRWRTLVVVGVALAAAAAIVALFLLRSSSETTRVPPAHRSAPRAAEALGPADCSSVMHRGDTSLAAVTITGRHALCITENGSSTSVYLDGRVNGGTTGLTPLGHGTWSIGGARAGDGTFFLVGNLIDDASALRLTFCDGRELRLRPLNDSNPRFVAASFDPERFGNPSPQQLDADGAPIGDVHNPSSPDHADTCVTPKSRATK